MSLSAPRRRRVLVDLSHASAGHVGIAQDIRIIFDMLESLPNVDVEGLLMATGRHDLPRIGVRMRDRSAVTAGVLHWMARNWSSREYPGILGKLGRLLELGSALRGTHELVALRAHERSPALWRTLFENSLPPGRRQAILGTAFQATDLSIMRIIDRSLAMPFLPPKQLAAHGFDAVLLSMPRPIGLPSGVRQLVRFHDAVPLTDPDTVDSWKSGLAHERLVRLCPPAATFVCNSPQTREDLLALDPRRERSSCVIPCAVGEAPTGTSSPVASILAGRRSFRVLGPTKAGHRPSLPGSDIRYVLSVSSLEPRKNHAGLIRAWERVVARSAPDLRLVMVANPGWREDVTVRAMTPHVLSGTIVHLENVPRDELWTLMRGASCFAFPSFNEGFGYPPLEALQAGTPSIVSDLPVFRWTLGSTAIYIDPYDPETLAQAIERLALDDGSLRASLLSGRDAVVDRFQPSNVRELWATLLDAEAEAYHIAQ